MRKSIIPLAESAECGLEAVLLFFSLWKLPMLEETLCAAYCECDKFH